MSHNLQLDIALNVAIDHLKRVENAIISAQGPTIGPDVSEQILLFFQHICDYNQCLLAKTTTQEKIDCSSGDLNELQTENVELYGIYKYFTNLCRKMESNYCKIHIDGVLIIDGDRQSKILYLSNLLDPNLLFLPEPITDTEPEPETEPILDGCYIDRDEVLKSLTELRNHYCAVMEFL